MGLDVVNMGLGCSGSREVGVSMEGGWGGIILSGRDNGREWNGLKLLNEDGELVNGGEGNEVLGIGGGEEFEFGDMEDIGKYGEDNR